MQEKEIQHAYHQYEKSKKEVEECTFSPNIRTLGAQKSEPSAKRKMTPQRS